MGKSEFRLIEDYLPIEAISAEASREKSLRKGHISTLHLWWARRPLVACRAAVYGALVPADRWVDAEKICTKKARGNGAANVESWKNGSAKGLNRKAAKDFMERLCRYPGDPRVIEQAEQHILEAHAERLTSELAEGRAAGWPPAWVKEFRFAGERVTSEDIVAGRAPRPRVLDMFAGGGTIPLEALRLGCEAYGVDLNPVAHVIELCTLVYPHKYGAPDPTARGMTGPKNEKGETTWGGLANEVQHWGNSVLTHLSADIGDLYPIIPDPEAPVDEFAPEPQRVMDFAERQPALKTTAKSLTPVAYLWSRTVRCKNPGCGATVPLLKQAWLCKKPRRTVALKVIAEKGEKQVRAEVTELNAEGQAAFEPGILSNAGNAVCPFCGTVADSAYVMAEGCADRMRNQLMAVVALRKGEKGKVYLSANPELNRQYLPSETDVTHRLSRTRERSLLDVPDEEISALRPSPNARGLSGLTRYGLNTFGKLFTARQQLLLLSICERVRQLGEAVPAHPEVIAAYLGLLVGRIANQNCALTVYHVSGEKIEGPMSDKKVPMVWDFPEANPFSGVTGSISNALDWIVAVIRVLAGGRARGAEVHVQRGDATALALDEGSMDAIITDPPYYDNVPYADISDFFYVWLKRSIADFFPEHFTSPLSPKKSEVTALASRHHGDMRKAKGEYESRMLAALGQANRILKTSGQLAIVYAHKTTLGWATLVDALRRSGFEVTEAWPIETEMPSGKVKLDKAMLASSIFIVGRKRKTEARVGSHEQQIRPELERIVIERVETLWNMGITGADLVIACVGAGLRAFTRYEKVEYANGEEVPAETFLAEVEGVVLDTMMAKLFGVTSGNVASVDAASRFYVLWRFVYKAADIGAGEAIVFTYGQHVELEDAQGLSVGKDALVEKRKARYRVRDFTERGSSERLGLPGEEGKPTPLIDVLHRVLWLMEHRPQRLGDFLDAARPDRERLRVLAQALAGAALSGKTGEDADRLLSTTAPEQAALAKLLANWKSLIPDSLFGPRK
ncbi:MAG: DUF1156 domain-containing protein [Bryobacteraceae bacterium]